MYEVNTRDVPERSLLCVKRNVADWDAAWALGKEFMALMKRAQLPRLDGHAGAVFCIYWGEVSEDSDGPLEWCRPVPGKQAQALAAAAPEFSLRTETAHTEAFVDLGRDDGTGTAADWQLVSESLRGWVEERRAQPSGLGARITYVWSRPITAETGPDCDFAVPLAGDAQSIAQNRTGGSASS